MTREQLTAGLMGTLAGALGGVALTGLEQALLFAMGVGRVPLEALTPALVAAVLIGASYGGLGGLAGFRRGRWMLFVVVATFGLLVSGRVHGLSLDRGLPAPVMAALAVGGAMLAGLLAALVVKRQGSAEAIATGTFFGGVLLLLVNQHWLASPLARTSLMVDGGLALFTLVLVMALWVVSPEQGFGALPVSALGAALGAASLFWTPVPTVPPLPTPTATGAPIVLVVVDTLRADRLTAAHAPRLWAWGQGSRRFTDVQAQASWTLPSVATVMTGVRPRAHGAGVHDGDHNLRSAMSLVPTLGEQLEAAGFTGVGVTTNPWTGAAYGFARGLAHLDERVGPGPLPLALHAPVTLGVPVGWPVYRDASSVLAAADALRAPLGDRGWFLFVHLMDVHGPHADPSGDAVADYDRAVAQLDGVLADWLATLPADTRVVLLSDHGEELDEDRNVEAGVPPGTRHGHTLYQELLHVPVWVRGLPPGASPELAGLDQVAATVLGLAGLTPPESWAPALGTPRTRPTVAEAIRFGPRADAARSGTLSLMRWHQQPLRRRVFDLAKDPEQHHDRQGAEPEREAELAAALDAQPVVSGPRVGTDAATHDLLERLGYLGEGE